MPDFRELMRYGLNDPICKENIELLICLQLEGFYSSLSMNRTLEISYKEEEKYNNSIDFCKSWSHNQISDNEFYFPNGVILRIIKE